MAKSTGNTPTLTYIHLRDLIGGGPTQCGRFETPDSKELEKIANALASPINSKPVTGDQDDETTVDYNGLTAGWSPEFPGVVTLVSGQLVCAPQTAIDAEMEWRKSLWETAKSSQSELFLKIVEEAYCVDGPNGKVLYEPKLKTAMCFVSGNTRKSQMINAAVIARSRGMEFSLMVPCLVRNDIQTRDQFIDHAIAGNTQRTEAVQLKMGDYIHFALIALRRGYNLAGFRAMMHTNGSNTARAWAAASLSNYSGIDIADLLRKKQLQPGDLVDDADNPNSIMQWFRMVSKVALEAYVKSAKTFPSFMKPYVDHLQKMRENPGQYTWEQVRKSREEVAAFINSLVALRASNQSAKKMPGAPKVDLDTLSASENKIIGDLALAVSSGNSDGIVFWNNPRMAQLCNAFQSIVKLLSTEGRDRQLVLFEAVIGDVAQATSKMTSDEMETHLNKIVEGLLSSGIPLKEAEMAEMAEEEAETVSEEA